MRSVPYSSCVVVPYGLGGQLAFLADRDEALVQRVGQRRAEDEAARLDAGDLVDLHVLVAVHQFVHGGAKTGRVLEQRGDVAELDALFRIVRDGADVGFDSHVDSLLFRKQIAIHHL